jgi:hypothetical protein
MEKRHHDRSAGKLAAAAAAASAMAGLAGLGVSDTNAAVVNRVLVDVRATQLNGASVADAKHVAVVAGDVISLNLFATVTGTNGLTMRVSGRSPLQSAPPLAGCWEI